MPWRVRPLVAGGARVRRPDPTRNQGGRRGTSSARQGHGQFREHVLPSINVRTELVVDIPVAIEGRKTMRTTPAIVHPTNRRRVDGRQHALLVIRPATQTVAQQDVIVGPARVGTATPAAANGRRVDVPVLAVHQRTMARVNFAELSH